MKPKELKLTEFLLTSVTVTVRCCETADYNQASTIIQKKSVNLSKETMEAEPQKSFWGRMTIDSVTLEPLLREESPRCTTRVTVNLPSPVTPN